MLTFNAIDVETANADRASICSIGVVHVQDGEIKDQWQTLVDPETWFDPWNVEVHGIDETDVGDSPTMPEIRGELRSRLRGSVLISHTSFDRVAFERAMSRYGLEQLQVTWLDSAKIVRRAWPERYARSGYGLSSVAHDLGISFRHHDALEDARAAAEVTLAACAAAKQDIKWWLQRVDGTIWGTTQPTAEKRDGKQEGEFYGETIVFTGKLGIPRRTATDMAAEVGFSVSGSVTKKTTMLVVGVQDMNKLKGYEKSSKHRKAEDLIAMYELDIQILSEQDFLDLVDVAEPTRIGDLR